MRLVLHHEHEHPSRRAAIMSISAKRAGVPMDIAAKLQALERENRELRQANEIQRKPSAYFARAELDHPVKY